MYRNPFSQIFRLGIEEIDKQHSRIIEVTNNLVDAVKAGAPQDEVDAILNRLKSVSAAHFTYEEMLMDNNPDYTAQDHHKRVHARLIQDLNEVADKLASGNECSSYDAIWTLREWVISHILDTDREFVDFLRSKGFK